MTTISCDFGQFSAKNLRFSQKPMLLSQFYAICDNFRLKQLAFFSKTDVMINFVNNLALF
jgi:hypothetical protein